MEPLELETATDESIAPAREGAGMAYDEALGHAIVFGGQDATSLFNDIRELIP